jgi:hypothetical protein
MYDYYLGGLHNFPADREMAQRVVSAYPTLPGILQQNRAFLRRVVRYMVRQGIRQFIDLGSGLPTVGNVHEIAQSEAVDAKVVYVDADPTAVLHSRLMLVGNPSATVLQLDLRNPDAVLDHRDLRWQIDLEKPVGLLAMAVLHFIGGDDDALALMKTYGQRLAPGSYIALSHGSGDRDPEGAARVQALYARTGSPMYFRPHGEIKTFFGDFQLVEPGLVLPNDWHPDLADAPLIDIADVSGYVGLARKP